MNNTQYINVIFLKRKCLERIERGRREWGEIELGRLTTIFAYSSKASPEGP